MLLGALAWALGVYEDGLLFLIHQVKHHQFMDVVHTRQRAPWRHKAADDAIIELELFGHREKFDVR